MCLGFHYKKLSEGELAKLKSLEGDLGSTIVALEKDKETKLTDLSPNEVKKIQDLEKDMDSVLVACKG